MKIKRTELKGLIRECIEELIAENVNRVVDNFDEIAKLINVTDPNDQFFFVQILKRWKDNKDKGMTKDIGDTYHGGYVGPIFR